MTDGGVPLVVEISGFRLDLRRLRLTGPDGAPIRLKPRDIRTLACLAAHAGEVVEKQTLLDAVWPGVVVEENNLNQAISALRRVLGDSREDPRFIVTEQGRGYRLIAPVRAVAADEPDDGTQRREAKPHALAGLAVRFGSRGRWALWIGGVVAALAVLVGAAVPLVSRPEATAARATAMREPTLVVLPFADRSEQADQQPFAYGLSDSLRDRLSAVDGLLVTGRTSSYAWGESGGDARDIGRVLDVAYVLDGSVTRVGDRLRVTAELADSADGYRIWSHSYDRELGEALEIERDIVWRVAGAIGVHLDPARRPEWATDDPVAYDLALRGWGMLAASTTPEGLFAAGELFRAATVRDPDYVPGWSGLQQSLVATAFLFPDRSEQVDRELDVVAERLTALDPVWGARMRFEQAMADDDLTAAREALDAARGLVSADILAWFRWRLDLKAGRPRAALDAVREEARRDPASILASARLQAVLYALGDAEEAEAEYRRGRELSGSPVERAAMEGTALFRALKEGYGREAVLERFDRFRAAVPAHEQAAFDPTAALDDPEAARAALRLALDTGAMSPRGIAWWADYLGDAGLAIEALRASPRLEDWGLFTPMLENTRRDPRFKDLLRERGYVAYWRATGEWSDFCRPVGEDDFECR